MRIAIIADTHLSGGIERLPERCLELMRSADLLLHAGDVSSVEALDGLEALGPPLRAVRGNIESPGVAARLAPTERVAVEGVRIAMVHDAGPRHGRLARLRAAFPDAAAVVFGHSHMPLLEGGNGFQIFNPGSPTQRRRAPAHTMGLADVSDGRVSFRHVELS
jgi:putative phosphoesterase